MASGLEMMMKALGIDPKAFNIEKIQSDFESLKANVERELKAIHAGIDRVEKRQEELCQMIRTSLAMSSQVRLVPQLPSPQQEQPQQLAQQE